MGIGDDVPALAFFMATDEEPMRGVTVGVFDGDERASRKLCATYGGAGRAIVGRFCFEFGV